MALLFSDDTYRSDKIFATLKELMPQADLRKYPDIGDPAQIDYAIIWRPRPGSLQNLPNLKAVFTTSAGVEAIVKDETLPDVPIIRNTDPALAHGIAEYVVYHVLHYQRFFNLYEAQQRTATWKQYPQRKPSDCTIGLMGLGEMGLAAARALSALGFGVRGWSRSEKRIDNMRCFYGADQMDEFLSGAQILVNILPLTDETKNILNAALFASLPKGAILLNIGRGLHLNEADLLEALDSGQLSAATLDVFPVEPLPSESPLWSHPKIKVTPHIASLTDYANIVRNIQENIGKLERGETMQGVVDRKRQY